MPTPRKIAALATTTLLALSMSVAQANSYTIEDLGINLDPHAINDDGVMVGSKGNQATEF